MVYGLYTAISPAVGTIAHFALIFIARLSAVSDFARISMGLRGYGAIKVQSEGVNRDYYKVAETVGIRTHPKSVFLERILLRDGQCSTAASKCATRRFCLRE